ncbi:cyclic nucleotide-monophosphate binding protein [Aureococcus anophagefferens]|uniref:Cyclic nucleotide-monophosphate binding protein n=1 Tax=Aureococcus anophagefferens TaxID=44056 RepID=A0ABR1GF23_AURAN
MGPATMGERLNLSEHHSVLSAQLLEKARHAATPGEAHRLIERARIIDPTNPVVLEQSAMVHRREGRFMECIGDLLVARRRAQQSLALDGFSGVPDVLRRAPEAAKMDAQGRPLTAATSASGATATPPGSALADGNLGDRSKHEVKQWMGILRHVRFFADLAKRTPKKEPVEGEAEAPNLLAEVAKVVTVVHCGGNDLVFAQGDEGHSFYVIYSGVVSITLNHEVDDGAGGTNATEIVVKRLQAGDAFGEAALAEGAHLRSANARAKTTCVLLSLPKDDYNRITAAATAEDQIIRAKHLAACPIFLTWPARRLAARTDVGSKIRVPRRRLADVSRRCVVKLYDAHSVIIREDDVAPELFIIKSGVVNLNKSVPESFCRPREPRRRSPGRVDDVSFEAEPPGLWVVQRNWKDLGDHHLFEPGEGTVEMLVAVLGSGQVFGELAVLDPNGRTPSSAVAVTNVEVYCLSKQALADVELLFDLPVVNYLNESLMLNNPPHKKLGSYYRNRRAWQDAKGRVLRKVMSGKWRGRWAGGAGAQRALSARGARPRPRPRRRRPPGAPAGGERGRRRRRRRRRAALDEAAAGRGVRPPAGSLLGELPASPEGSVASTLSGAAGSRRRTKVEDYDREAPSRKSIKQRSLRPAWKSNLQPDFNVLL